MEKEKSIVTEIFKDTSFSKKEIIFIESIFQKTTLKKGDLLLNPNAFINNQYYISEGCLRAYFVGKDAKEHTVQFAIKDWWISDYTAYFTEEKSIMSIECIQDAIIYKVSKKNMECLYATIPRLETFFRKKLEKAFASFQKRILVYLSQPAIERYRIFISKYPNIEQSVKNYHIASYLGVTTESLSRIRKILLKK
jgi:CRP-like cAMP-binding protein